MALSKAIVEVIWIHKLLYELGFLQITPTTIYFDNQNVIFSLIINPKFHSRNKHINTQYHFICDQILFFKNLLIYVPTTKMTIDILTKILLQNKHISCMDALGMTTYPSTPIKHFFLSKHSWCGSLKPNNNAPCNIQIVYKHMVKLKHFMLS
jgi:hypothetical protein